MEVATTVVPDASTPDDGEPDSSTAPDETEPDEIELEPDKTEPDSSTAAEIEDPEKQDGAEVESGVQVTTTEDDRIRITGTGNASTNVELGEGEWTALSTVTENRGAWFSVRLLGSPDSATTLCWNHGRGVLLADTGAAETQIDSTLAIVINNSSDAWCEPGSFTVTVSAAGSWTVTFINKADATPQPEPIGIASSDIRFTQISVGRDHTCGVTTAKTVQCWGRTTFGKATPPAGEFEHVSAGDSHTCGLTVEGTVECWGDGYYGQTAAPEGTFVQATRSCALRADGSFVCWGRNGLVESPPEIRLKRLADGMWCGIATDSSLLCWHLADRYSDTPTMAFTEDLLSGSFLHIGNRCGTRTDGSVSCWNASPPDSASPPGDDTFTSTSDLCGITTDEEIRCWGSGQYGRANQPEEAPKGRYIQVSGGSFHACALTTDGRARCWGEGYAATPPPADGEFVSVSVGNPHACGITVDRELKCWGYEFRGPAPAVEGWRAPAFGGLPPGEFTQVSVGAWSWDDLSCAVRVDGSVACWDYDGPEEDSVRGEGRNAIGVSVGTQRVCVSFADGGAECTPKRAHDDAVESSTAPDRFADISTGQSRSCGVRIDGALSCWGGEELWPADPEGSGFVQVSASIQQICAVRTDHSLHCWHPRLQALADVRSLVPESPPGGAYEMSSLGITYGCAVRVDGEVACWGAGALGRADPPPGPFAYVSVGRDYACGVDRNGRIKCWA